VVKDAQGGAVAGATVTIHNTETGLTRSLTTGRPRGRGGTPAPTVKNIQTGSNHSKLLGPILGRDRIQSRDEHGEVGGGLGMIWINFEVSKQEGFTAGQVAPAVRFHCYEHGVNLFKRLWIIKLEHPTFLG
jgi:hypothetical protein